jgi:hypothetical protein
MHWRLSIDEWKAGKGEGNRAAMKAVARRKTPPGVVAYDGDEPVAWCRYGARADFPCMQRSALLKPVDDEPVISLTCMFIKKGRRGDGLCTQLIKAVCDHLAVNGDAPAVEAYPVDPAKGRRAGADTAMTGIASAFAAAGSPRSRAPSVTDR